MNFGENLKSIAVPLEGDEFEMPLADDSVPADADYAVCISGDSTLNI